MTPFITPEAAERPNKSLFKKLCCCFKKEPKSPFAPKRLAPLCLLPTQDDIQITVDKVAIDPQYYWKSHQSSAESVGTPNKKQCTLTARATVTVSARCCCGPKGKPIRLAKRCKSARHTSAGGPIVANMVQASVDGAEGVAQRAYREARAEATVKATTALMREYARQASAVLSADPAKGSVYT